MSKHSAQMQALPEQVQEIGKNNNAWEIQELTLVGYSMGARIALHMALRPSAKIKGVVISGSPGLRDHTERKLRAARDDSRASSLLCFGLTSFMENWYTGELWQSLRKHPSFKNLATTRLQHDDVCGLAKVLSDLSIGRQMFVSI